MFLVIINLFARLFVLILCIVWGVMSIHDLIYEENFKYKVILTIFSIVFVVCALGILFNGIIYFNII